MTIETKLNNGAEVFAEVKIGDTHWVAAEWHNGTHVTWKVANGEAYYGHYFSGTDSKREALADMLARAKFKTY